jgi:hypothetical protein
LTNFFDWFADRISREEFSEKLEEPISTILEIVFTKSDDELKELVKIVTEDIKALALDNVDNKNQLIGIAMNIIVRNSDYIYDQLYDYAIGLIDEAIKDKKDGILTEQEYETIKECIYQILRNLGPIFVDDYFYFEDIDYDRYWNELHPEYNMPDDVLGARDGEDTGKSRGYDDGFSDYEPENPFIEDLGPVYLEAFMSAYEEAYSGECQLGAYHRTHLAEKGIYDATHDAMDSGFLAGKEGEEKESTKVWESWEIADWMTDEYLEAYNDTYTAVYEEYYEKGQNDDTEEYEVDYSKALEAYHTVSLIKNFTTILNNHYPQVTIALLKENDSNYCNISFDANGGEGKMDSLKVAKGSEYTLTGCNFKAPSGKVFDGWNKGKVGTKIKIDGDISIVANWKKKSSGSSSSSGTSSYKITTTIENGTITPNNVSVKKNSNQEFKFSANEGYEIVDVLVDGKSVGEVNEYTLEKVTAKHTIEVKTQKVSMLENVDGWVKEEIALAEEKGLIPETFVKKDASKAISRADFCAVAVKLYEALTGNKVEAVTNNPFYDTKDEYVLKAYNVGITKGVSETEFGNSTITREQMATMISRGLMKAGINTIIDLENITKFTDDDEMHDWGRPSVYFMAKEDIIKGVGDNKFNPLGEAKIEEALAISLRCFRKN